MKTPDTGLSLVLTLALVATHAHAGDIKPSRLLPADQIPSLVESVAPKLSIAERATDPFGQYQVPQDDIPVRPPHPPVPGGGLIKQMPFAQVVNRIPVAALMPGAQRVMIAGKTYAVGEDFPVNLKGSKLKIEVTKVTDRAVEFRNVDTGELGTYDFIKGADPLKKEELRKDFAPEPLIELN